MVEKMIKRTKNNPIPESSYAESNAVAIELILWHKYKTREKSIKRNQAK